MPLVLVLKRQCARKLLFDYWTIWVHIRCMRVSIPYWFVRYLNALETWIQCPASRGRTLKQCWLDFCICSQCPRIVEVRIAFVRIGSRDRGRLGFCVVCGFFLSSKLYISSLPVDSTSSPSEKGRDGRVHAQGTRLPGRYALSKLKFWAGYALSTTPCLCCNWDLIWKQEPVAKLAGVLCSHEFGSWLLGTISSLFLDGSAGWVRQYLFSDNIFWNCFLIVNCVQMVLFIP